MTLHNFDLPDDTVSTLPKIPKYFLNKEETEVLQLVCGGYSTVEMGAILGVSHQTVGYRLAKIREKLEAITTSQAVYIAMREGLVK